MNKKNYPPTFYQNRIQLMPGSEAFELFEKWWSAKPQDKKQHLKKLDEHMEMLEKKAKALVEHYEKKHD